MALRAFVMQLFAILVLASTAPACHKKIKPEECTAMLDRYIDMIVAAEPSLQNLPPEQSVAVRQVKKAAKKAEANYVHVQTQCEAEVSQKEYDCAMGAKNADEWEACIE
jgi:hypothetical protein